jgi:YegS/Rv2252/BmrU family lipid kinase
MYLKAKRGKGKYLIQKFLFPPVGHKKKALFIVNPVSGKKINRWINTQGLKLLRRSYLEMDVIQTRHEGDAPAIVAENLDRYDIFVAVGGDGTANEVAGKLIGTGKVFSVLPSGSGNGCARELKLPPIGPALIKLLVKGVTKKMDVLYVNGRHSINVSGVGFDALVSKRFDHRVTRGFISYINIVLRSFFSYQPETYRFFCDGKEINTQAFLVCFANTRQFGNNAFIAPKAKHNDGLIEVVVVKSFPKWYGVPFAFLLMTKQINRSKYVETYACREVLFDTNDELWVQIDGDPVKMEGPIRVTIEPEALRVFDTKNSN